MVVCPVCGTPYANDTSERCENCETPRPWPPCKPAPNPIYCENCGIELGNNNRICANYGVRTAFGKSVDQMIGKE